MRHISAFAIRRLSLFAPGALAPILVAVVLGGGCKQAQDTPGRSGGTETVEPDPTHRSAGMERSTGPILPGQPGQPGQTTQFVTLFVLSDRRCTARGCKTEPVVRQLVKSIPGLRIETLDYGSVEGKKLFEQEGLRLLPAYLFSPDITGHPSHTRFERHLRATPKGKLRQLKVRADWDPQAEICDNGVDDTGNGKVDCADPTCESAAVCRPEQKKRLDLFTMSMCPFGTQAMDSMAEVLKAFEHGIDFRIHFIATESGQGFKALHGQPEVDENIRVLCAVKHYPKGHKYLDYIWCRNRKIKDRDWKACTGPKTGIDAGVIERCAGGEEGKALLGESLKLAQTLKIAASPTWLANNRFVFHAIAPEQVKQGLCKHNPGLKGCEKKLSDKATAPNAVCN